MVFVANTVSAVTTGQVAVVGQSCSAARVSGFPVYNVDNACADVERARPSRARCRVRPRLGGTGRRRREAFRPDRSDSFRALNGAVDTEFLATAQIRPEAESVFVAASIPKGWRVPGQLRALGRTLAAIAVKNRRHAAANPRAQYREPLTAEDVLAARGGRADDGADVRPDQRWRGCHRRRGADRAAGREPAGLDPRIAAGMGGAPVMAAITVGRTARRAFGEAGVTPDDIDLAEVHDSTAFNELLAYEELGLCEPGGGALALSGDSTIGGAVRLTPAAASSRAGIRWRRPVWHRSASWSGNCGGGGRAAGAGCARRCRGERRGLRCR